MKNVILIAFLGAAISVSAQSIETQVIGSLGDNFENASIGTCFTAGEAIIESHSGAQVTVNQGFHQNLVETSGMEELTKNEQINVYPNPAQSFVNIPLDQVQDEYSIEIYDLSGQRVFVQVVTLNSYDSSLQLDVASLTPGIYQLKMIGSTGNVKNSKFIKQ